MSLFMFCFVFSAMVILICMACWLQVTASHWYVRRFMLSLRVDLGVWRFCGSALSSTSSFWTRCSSAVAWSLRYAARIADVSVHVWCLLLLPLLILSFFFSIIAIIIRCVRHRHLLLPVLHPLSFSLLCLILCIVDYHHHHHLHCRAGTRVINTSVSAFSALSASLSPPLNRHHQQQYQRHRTCVLFHKHICVCFLFSFLPAFSSP